MQKVFEASTQKKTEKRLDSSASVWAGGQHTEPFTSTCTGSTITGSRSSSRSRTRRGTELIPAFTSLIQPDSVHVPRWYFASFYSNRWLSVSTPRLLTQTPILLFICNMQVVMFHTVRLLENIDYSVCSPSSVYSNSPTTVIRNQTSRQNTYCSRLQWSQEHRNTLPGSKNNISF